MEHRPIVSRRFAGAMLGGALAVAMALAGCGPTLMPTPVAFVGGAVDPLEVSPDTEPDTHSQVIIATDRKPLRQPSSSKAYYSNKRSRQMRVAVADVTLGRGLSWDELHEQSLLESRDMKVPVTFDGIREIGALWTDIPPIKADESLDPEVSAEFIEVIESALAKSTTKDAYIFVHGFNTKIPGNTNVAAELHHYLGNSGVFISYEWPSRGSLFAYSKDKANAVYSTRYLRLLIQYLARHTSVDRIHLLGHSAGAPPTVEAVRQLRIAHHDQPPEWLHERYRIENVVLVAPDMDLLAFVNAQHDGFSDVSKTSAIYISTRDKALDFSSWIYGFARLGNPLKALSVIDLGQLEDHPNIQVIDVAKAEKHHGTWLGHSYFHEDPWVSSDLLLLLRHGGDPEQRGLTRDGDNPIWQFPVDYPERAKAAAQRLYRGTTPTGQ